MYNDFDSYWTDRLRLSIQHTNVNSPEILKDFRELEMLNTSELNGQIFWNQYMSLKRSGT